MLTKFKKKRINECADHGQSRARLSKMRLWLFDMDDTLFHASDGMLSAIHRKMECFIADKLDLSIQEAAQLQHAYWREYGATFLGLHRHEKIDPQEFFDATHRFDLSAYLSTDLSAQRLRRVIGRLPGKKVVITNGPGCYAAEVLRLLKIDDVFDAVISANDMKRLGRWRCKPDATLLASVCAQMGVRPEHSVLIEDSPGNLKAAKSLGMYTIWCVGYRKHAPSPVQAHIWADRVIQNLSDICVGNESVRT